MDLSQPYIFCQICFQQPDYEGNGGNDGFWLTSCAHILCSNHVNVVNSNDIAIMKITCPVCNVDEVSVIGLNSNLPLELAPYFEPFIQSLESLFASAKFQYSNLIDLINHQKKTIMKLHSKVTDQRKVMKTVRSELVLARDWKKKLDQYTKENELLRSKLKQNSRSDSMNSNSNSDLYYQDIQNRQLVTPSLSDHESRSNTQQQENNNDLKNGNVSGIGKQQSRKDFLNSIHQNSIRRTPASYIPLTTPSSFNFQKSNLNLNNRLNDSLLDNFSPIGMNSNLQLNNSFQSPLSLKNNNNNNNNNGLNQRRYSSSSSNILPQNNNYKISKLPGFNYKPRLSNGSNTSNNRNSGGNLTPLSAASSIDSPVIMANNRRKSFGLNIDDGYNNNNNNNNNNSNLNLNNGIIRPRTISQRSIINNLRLSSRSLTSESNINNLNNNINVNNNRNFRSMLNTPIIDDKRSRGLGGNINNRHRAEFNIPVSGASSPIFKRGKR